MTKIESEKQKPSILRWCPCEAGCPEKEVCKSECLRFQAYVANESVRNRRKNFIRFAEKSNARNSN